MKHAHSSIATALAFALLSVLPAQAQPISGLGLLGQVPGMPRDAQAAYALWQHNADGAIKTDENGTEQPAGALKTAEDGLHRAMGPTDEAGAQAEVNAQMASPQVAQQRAMAEQMQKKYGTPEGQAELQNMSPEQMMAMARQMQGQQGGQMPRSVSPHDQKLLQRIHGYNGAQALALWSGPFRSRLMAMEQEWQDKEDALKTQAENEVSKLPETCHPGGDYATVDPAREGAIRLGYANKVIALANNYLHKLSVLQQEAHNHLQPLVANGDEAMAAWGKIGDPALKSRVASGAQAEESQGMSEGVAAVLVIVHDNSLHAAKAIADKKQLEKQFAHASCK